MLSFPPAPNHVRHPPQGLSELRKSTFFLRGKNSTHWLFSNPPNPPHTLPVHDVIHIPRSRLPSGIFILTSLNDTSPTCAWTPALMLHLTNPCAKWKVLSLTRPKGKIYKTKSLAHYITHLIYARSPNLIIVNNNNNNNKKKENLPNCGHCRSGWGQSKTERGWK